MSTREKTKEVVAFLQQSGGAAHFHRAGDVLLSCFDEDYKQTDRITGCWVREEPKTISLAILDLVLEEITLYKKPRA